MAEAKDPQLNLEQQKIAEMKHEWDALFSGFQFDRALSDEMFETIVKNYTDNQRFYHNLDHVQDILNIIEENNGQLKNVLALKLAAWFHDLIAEKRAPDNEEKSAHSAQEFLQKLNIPKDIIQEAINLILATKKHQTDIDDQDLLLFLDADMAILGAEPKKYQKYAQAIAREYSFAPVAEYRQRRKELLTAFLERDRIYLTQPMFEKYEQQARQNIQSEIDSL